MILTDRRLLAFTGIVVLAAAAALGADEHTATRQIRVGPLERVYHIHVPPSYDKSHPVPLILAFHGGGGSALKMEGLTLLSRLSDKEGFIVAYPQALEQNWNDGRSAEIIREQRDRIDDIAFVGALLDEIGSSYAIDLQRIYATGVSNGGIFCHYLALKMASRFAAIAPVVGGIAEPIAGTYKPAEPLSVLIIQGKSDPLMPFEGGAVAGNRGRVISTAAAVKIWMAVDGCAPQAVEAELPDRDPQDQTRTRVLRYVGKTPGLEVTLFEIEGGGHGWPGSVQGRDLPERIVGVISRDFDATMVIWSFFKTHPKTK